MTISSSATANSTIRNSTTLQSTSPASQPRAQSTRVDYPTEKNGSMSQPRDSSLRQQMIDRMPWVICLIGLLTRVWQLGYHSIWFDEAVSLKWAASDATFIWQKTFPLVEDKHPPVYYLSLHYWQSILGWVGLAESDIALRLWGALLGIVTVWAIMQLATALSGRTTGYLTGLLVALSPLLVWYSQELRMFQPATTGSTVAAYALWRAWDGKTPGQQWRWWLLFVVAMSAALYSYLFSAFLMPAAGLTLLVLVFTAQGTTDRWPRFVRGLLAIGITGLLFLPLAYNAWMVNGNEGDPGTAFADAIPNLWRLLRIFTIWRVPWETTWVTIVLSLFAAYILLGLLLPQRAQSTEQRSPVRAWLALWIGIPLLIGNLLLSRSGSVFSEDRYFLFLTPFVLWAAARGAVAISRWARGPVWPRTVALVIPIALALPHLWTPAMYREQWRAAADHVMAYQAASPSLPSTVVTHIDYTHLPWEWYLRQEYSFDELPLYHPYGGALTPEDIDPTIAPPLQGIVDTGAATLWLSQSHLEGVDEARLVEGWLQEHFPLVTELYPAGIKLSGFALQHQFPELPQLAETAHYPATALAPNLELVACEVTTQQVAAEETIMHPPSGWVHVRLWWQATGPVDDDYIATARVIGVEGVWGERLYRGNETLRRYPTSSWQPGTIYRDEVDINLNPVTPARHFPVVIGLMDGAGTSVENTVECGTVEIVH